MKIIIIVSACCAALGVLGQVLMNKGSNSVPPVQPPPFKKHWKALPAEQQEEAREKWQQWSRGQLAAIRAHNQVRERSPMHEAWERATDPRTGITDHNKLSPEMRLKWDEAILREAKAQQTRGPSKRLRQIVGERQSEEMRSIFFALLHGRREFESGRLNRVQAYQEVRSNLEPGITVTEAELDQLFAVEAAESLWVKD